MSVSCCNTTMKSKRCYVKKNKTKKIYKLPRKFSKKYCLSKHKKLGFSEKASCAPYLSCKQFMKGGSKGQIRAICVLHENKSNIHGNIKFIEKNNKVKVEYLIHNLSDGKHGFHVHQYGDLTEGCASACSHFNPHNSVHGGRKSLHRHVGDLGNIISKNNIAQGYFYDKHISLKYNNINCIIGRSIVIHDSEDDNGKGNDAESLKTGNAGKRLACGVIGITH